jgi:hypothetical protein
MSGQIAIAPSILTRYLSEGAANLTVDAGDFAVIESGRIGAYPNHAIHPEAGISVRDSGVIALQSAVRPDELDAPTVWVRTSGPTGELVARATVASYFGFRPRAWVDQPDGDAEVVICDEAAAIAPLETGHRTDLSRAWFVLTGLPLVTHVLAVPPDAVAETVEAVAAWFTGMGELDKEERRSAREAIAAETGASPSEIAALMDGVRCVMGVDERRSIAELFARAGVANQVGPIRWYKNEPEPEADAPGLGRSWIGARR